jgi:NAD(P)-dependent dehydrogenase (short-subunit alcohol dehydrogenase family)
MTEVESRGAHVAEQSRVREKATDLRFFVTGSARGLGRSISERILAAGHRVAASARNPAALDDLVARYGEKILPLRLDVTEPDAAEKAIRRAAGAFGGLDVLINNAGFAIVGPVEHMPLASIEAQMKTNFLGTVNVTKAVLPLFRQQGFGHIIQVSSIGDRTATAGAAAYFASKWAVAGFSESLAKEVRPLGIDITIVEPGGMRTDFAEDSSITIMPTDEAYTETVGVTAKMMKSPAYTERLGDPSAVAGLILRIAELENPPLRILTGARPYTIGTGADRARAEADERWKWLSDTVNDQAFPA